jgi:hypothetical protein
VLWGRRAAGSVTLAVILTVAGALRAWSVFSGELVWHPDEIFMVIYPLNLFSGDLNPHVFSYPSFHYYELGLLYGVDFLQQYLTGDVDLFDWIANRYFVDSVPIRDLGRWLGVVYAVGTVALAGVLGGRLGSGRGITSAAGLLAAALMAVNVVHVRQSPLATVDTPLTFWFAAAAVASVRLLSADRRRDYLLAGVLVGITAATKYPGVACCVGVVAAHLISGRHFLDPRLWLAGASTCLTFALLSPYVLLDFATFSDHFLSQVAHAESGRFGTEAGPLFHLGNGLRHGVGWPAWVLWLATCGWVVVRRKPAHLVVLAMTVGGYAAVSWGDLVFLRYVLSLLPLQAALVGSGAGRALVTLRNRIPQVRPIWSSAVAVGLLLALPLSASLQVAEFSSRRDTRTLARDWFHEHVPAGASVCNFGGWPGDIPLRTYDGQWWRLNGFLTIWPPGSQAQLAEALAPLDPRVPFYEQAVRNNNREEGTGSVELIHERQCAYVVTHEHALPYSTIDSTFAARLRREATLVADFDPEIGDGIVYDTMDGYYIPVSGFDVGRPGPHIEIWEIPAYRTSPKPTSQRHVFSRVLSQMAVNALDDADPAAGMEALRAARSFDPGNDHALLVEARLHWDAGDTAGVRQSLVEMLRRDSTATRAMEGLAKLAAARGDTSAARDWMEQVSRRRPRDAGGSASARRSPLGGRGSKRGDSAVAPGGRAEAVAGAGASRSRLRTARDGSQSTSPVASRAGHRDRTRFSVLLPVGVVGAGDSRSVRKGGRTASTCWDETRGLRTQATAAGAWSPSELSVRSPITEWADSTARTIAPPTSAAAPGCSSSTSHTRYGPRTASRRPMRATSCAGR